MKDTLEAIVEAYDIIAEFKNGKAALKT